MPKRYLTLYFDSAIITKTHLLALVAGECYQIKTDNSYGPALYQCGAVHCQSVHIQTDFKCFNKDQFQ